MESAVTRGQNRPSKNQQNQNQDSEQSRFGAKRGNKYSASTVITLGLLQTLLFISSITGTNSQQISPSKDKTAELQDVLVAVGEKLNLTCRYSGFQRSSVMEIQWQKDSFPLISASPGMNNKFDVDNMFIQFNGDCDSRVQPCIADLHVQNAEPSDSGLYQCVGSSDIGATRSAFYNVRVINHYRPNDVRMRVIESSSGRTSNSSSSFASSSSGSGRELSVYQGQSVTFQCSSNGFPSPSLNFYLEGTLIPVFAKTFNNIEVLDVSIRQSSSGASVQQNMTVNHIGIWKSVLAWHCTAKNVEGESKSRVVYTRYHFAPQIISTRTEWRVLKHSDVTVPCYYREGFPTDTEVRWVFGSNPSGGTIVSRNQNLTFKAQEFDSGKEGEYTCIVENAVGQDFLTIKLLVDYAPIVTLDQSQVNVVEGERMSLVCRVSAQPEATIQWTLKGSSANMEFQSFKDKPSLVISNVEQYHSGKISCIATNKYGSTEAHAQVTVQYPPSINLKIEPTRSTNDYREGERIQFKCIVDSVPPPKLIEVSRVDHSPFTHNVILPYTNTNKSYFASGEISGESKKIVEVSSLERSHSGQYKCLAKNGLGVVNHHTISLRVQYGPEIAEMKPVYKNEGASLSLHCLVQSEPPASIVWLHPSKGQVSNKRQLEVTRLSRSDSGTYTCTASVSYYDGIRQSDSQTVDVYVNYDPEISICGDSAVDDGVYARIGSPVDLCCSVNSFPQSTISWFKLDQSSPRPLALTPKVINQTSSRFRSSIQSIVQLPKLTEADMGTYLCEAKNKFTSKTRTLYVKQLRIPLAPVLNTASPDQTGGIRLMWQTDKLAQYYQIGYRLDGSPQEYKVLPSREDRDTSVIPDLERGKPYQFVVRSCNQAGCSPFSNPLSSEPITIPNTPMKGGAASIPVSTVVVVPLALVGLILLLSLLVLICRRRNNNRRAQKDDDRGSVAIAASDAYTPSANAKYSPYPYSSHPHYQPHAHTNGGSILRSGSPPHHPLTNGGPPGTLISSYSGHQIVANPGAIVTSTAYPLKTAGGGGGGGILVDRGPPGVPHTNGHVLKGLSLPDEKYSANQSYITITQPNGSLIRSPLNSMSGGNEVGKFSPTPSQTSPSSLPPSEEHMDSNGGPKAIYLQNMSMDRVAFSKLKGDGSLSDSSTKEQRDRVRFTDANGITHYPGGEEEPETLPPANNKFHSLKHNSSIHSNNHMNNSNAKYSTLPTSANTGGGGGGNPPLGQGGGGLIQNYRPNLQGQTPTSATVVLANGNLPQQPAQIAITPDIYFQQPPGASIVMNNKPPTNQLPPAASTGGAPAPPLRKTQRLSPIETNGVPLGTVIKPNQSSTTNLIPPNTKFVVYPPSASSDKQSSSLTSSNSPNMAECVSPFTESMSGSLSSDNTTSNRSQTGFSVTSV
ncbi:hemicentin-1-like isoform X3 [Symsagittifera roscoffensis]|uniref:hemicentin-1-like isoform X3 n=1 Tax=Symsagittifera roscoffensis TaxID=84072 RepID=UPI00307BEC85